ncbi:hypothetical protein LXA43DRAFT_1061971 [Ganoderma leucocontextum]|nr:hypothetical protein LXA43DRAFT_1061971 [Ganoderma leucocontextum]
MNSVVKGFKDFRDLDTAWDSEAVHEDATVALVTTSLQQCHVLATALDKSDDAAFFRAPPIQRCGGLNKSFVDFLDEHFNGGATFGRVIFPIESTRSLAGVPAPSKSQERIREIAKDLNDNNSINGLSGVRSESTPGSSFCPVKSQPCFPAPSDPSSTRSPFIDDPRPPNVPSSSSPPAPRRTGPYIDINSESINGRNLKLAAPILTHWHADIASESESESGGWHVDFKMSSTAPQSWASGTGGRPMDNELQ